LVDDVTAVTASAVFIKLIYFTELLQVRRVPVFVSHWT